MNTRLRVGDTVWMLQHTGSPIIGLVTAVREQIFVRWDDGVIGVFDRKHVHYLVKIEAGERAA